MSGKPISAADPPGPARLRLGAAALIDGPFPKPVMAGGHQLVLVRTGGRLVAAERACPHEGADLALGRCTAGRLHCPRHQASFDLETGAVSPGWSFRGLDVYPVEAGEDGLWIVIAPRPRDDAFPGGGGRRSDAGEDVSPCGRVDE